MYLHRCFTVQIYEKYYPISQLLAACQLDTQQGDEGSQQGEPVHLFVEEYQRARQGEDRIQVDVVA